MKTIKSVKTRMMSFLLVCAMVIGSFMALPGSANAAGAAVKNSEWKKITVGRLNKDQVSWVLNAMVLQYGNNKRTMTVKKWDKQVKKDGGFWIVEFTTKLYPGEKWGEYLVGTAHKLTSANKKLAFCSNYRLKKNQKKKTVGYRVGFRTGADKVYYYPEGLGGTSEATITSAKYSGIIIKFKETNGGDLVGNFKATLKKVKSGQNKGKYKLVKIVKVS